MANLTSDETGTSEIWVAVGITKNLGNYESLRIDASKKIVVKSNDEKAAWTQLWDDVEAQVESKIEESDSALKDA